MRNFTFSILLMVVAISFAYKCFSQAAGDFQTKIPTGNWSDFNSWNIYNGISWQAAVAGQIPSATSSVYVQMGQTINVDDANAVCNNLDFNTYGSVTSKIAFTTASSILNVKGNFIVFNTSPNCFGTWAAGAKIVFSGAGTQGFTNLSVTSVFSNIEVNKPSGSLTTSSNFRFDTFTLTAGNFIVGSAHEMQGNTASSTININGGLWTQISSTTRIYSILPTNPSPLSSLNINGGSMVLQTSTGTTGFMFSSITVTNGGTFTLNHFTGSGIISISTAMNVDATSVFNTALTTTPLPSSVVYDGLVNYNYGGAQTISAASYSHLQLSGTGLKTLGTGTTTIPANGTLEMSVPTNPAFSLGGNTFTVSSINTNLIYSSAASQTAGTEWIDPNFQNVTINNLAGVSMAGLARTINGSLNLTNGTLNIGVSGSLTLDGASLNKTNGYINGTNSSDLSVIGTTGGTVLLPLSGNISLRNITVDGNRILQMNGVNHINLSGVFNINSGATYDNGGESQIINGATGSINIIGKFINRDKENFTGTNGAIPGIIPTLNSGCTIEYGLATGGPQTITARADYQNVTFSGSGTKSPPLLSPFTPAGTVYITGSATVDAVSNLGDGSTPTNLTMDGGRLILELAGTQPMMAGTYNLSGGIIQFNFNGVGPQSIRSASYQNIEVTGNGVGISTGNINLNNNGTFTVKNGGIFRMSDETIKGVPADGTQIVAVENGGTFRCGNNQGFNGYPVGFGQYSSIDQSIVNINLNAGSTVEYMRAGNQQITNANTLIYSNLLITGSGIKTAPPLMPSAPSPILTVRGNLTKSGTSTFIHNGGTVLLDSTGAQTFAGLTYNNLILTNNVKTTNGNSIIIDSIKINDGTTLSVSAFDTITLRSDPATTKTARVGQIGTGNINYGTDSKFVVERYIPAKRAWRFLSVATNSLQTIKQAWQENSIDINDNPKPGYGTQITDNNIATFAANGFDAYSQNGPSMKTYNPSTDTYTGIPNTNVIAFDPTLGGYMTFIRGDRTAIAFGSPVTSTVLRTVGQLYTGDQPGISLTTGWAVPVNNYYASPIDLRNISTSPNIFFYVWDPNYATGYGLGGFQTLSWNVTDNDYDVFPGNTGSYGTKNNFIESGQAFFASTFGPGLSLPVTENAKGISVPSIEPFIPQGIPGQKLKTYLYTVNSDSTTTLADAVMNSFADDYSNAVDGMDAKKLFNFGENISIKTSGELLVIERKHTVVEQDTVFLNLSGLSVQQYRLRFDAANMNTGNLEAFAEDTYLHTRTSINLDGVTDINFTVTEAAGSYASNRFRIIFSPAAGALPVTFTSVKAFQKSENIVVEWKVENEINIKRYEVEKSLNGTQFTILSIIAAGATNSSYTVDYSSTDTRPAAGYNYYRIKSVDVNGTIKYSDVVKVLIGNTKRSIMIYPNPVKNSMLRIQFNNQPSGPYLLKLVNNVGQVSISKQIDHVEGSHIETIALEKLAHGIYHLEIIFPEGNKKSLNFIY